MSGDEVLRRLPPGVRGFLDQGGWWVVIIVGGLLGLVLFFGAVRLVWRKAFAARRRPFLESDREFEENLADCPLSAAPPQERQLTVYHLPVRMRLVVVAPVGREADFDAMAVENLLDKVIPGLGDIARWDRPRIRVWPAQYSTQGFAIAFQRRLHKPDPEGKPSRWILVAGRALIGRVPVMIGLALWAEKANMIGKVNLEPHQWLDVLRLQRAGN
ncbi:MAG: hypothetical protein ACJ8FY_08555 [Gemmataceae bacterium]